MTGKVLVLNADYAPITVCTLERAFTLVWMKKAESLKNYEERWIRTVSTDYPMPAVVKLNKYINLPYRSVVMSRNNIFKRDGFVCQYCGSTKNLTLDHVIPKSKGGKSTWTNLVTACQNCNSYKGDQNYSDLGMELKKKPIKPSYLSFIKDFSDRTMEEWSPYLNLSA